MNLAAFLRSFSKAVRENRIALGITQAELALKSNVSAATIKRVEAGGSCGLKEFCRLMKILNPALVDRIYTSMAFNPLDFTQDPVQGIKLLSDIQKTRRIREKVNPNNG